MHVGGVHGFMNLYNYGFAGGLATLIIIGFIKGFAHCSYWMKSLRDNPFVEPTCRGCFCVH